MSKFAVCIFAICCAVSAAAQTKTLIEKSHIVTTIPSYGAYGLPTACDDRGRMYVKLNEPGKGAMSGPVYRVSPDGALEATFDTTGALTNRFAVLPSGGIATLRREEKTNLVDYFGPDGRRERTVSLEGPSFVPLQIAAFRSGETFLAYSGGRGAVYDPAGHLINDFPLKAAEKPATTPAGASRQFYESVGNWSVLTGDDGYVYILEPTSPATVLVISPAGEVVRKFSVATPSDTDLKHMPLFRVAKGRMLIAFSVQCDEKGGCKARAYHVVDAKTGQTIGQYFGDNNLGGPLACYSPEPDRIVNFFWKVPDGRYLEILEAQAK